MLYPLLSQCSNAWRSPDCFWQCRRTRRHPPQTRSQSEASGRSLESRLVWEREGCPSSPSARMVSALTKKRERDHNVFKHFIIHEHEKSNSNKCCWRILFLLSCCATVHRHEKHQRVELLWNDMTILMYVIPRGCWMLHSDSSVQLKAHLWWGSRSTCRSNYTSILLQQV